MHKQTKHNKRIKRKNKTLKYYGGEPVVPLQNIEVPNTVPIIKDNSSELTKKANEVVKELAKKILTILGLEFKNNPDSVNSVNSELPTNNGISASNVLSNVIADAVNVVDVAASAGVEVIGNVLPETAERGKEIIQSINNTLNRDEMKAIAKNTLENVVVYGEIMDKALDQNTLNKLNQLVSKVGTTVSEAAVNTAINVAGGVPLLGIVVAAAKVLTNGTNAVADVNESISTAKNIITDIKENVDEILNKFKEQKKEVDQIASRTADSINEFKDPLNKANAISQANAISGGKTRRKLFKRNIKSKRVRFDI